MGSLKKFFSGIIVALTLALMSCDKDVCRDCYLVRSMLCTYTDTTLAAYIIPGDTVKTEQQCDKEKDFNEHKFLQAQYESDSPSMLSPSHYGPVVVTHLDHCPEKTN